MRDRLFTLPRELAPFSTSPAERSMLSVCEIRRRYDGTAMLARVGGQMAMPDLLNLIARGNGCTLNDAPTPNGIRCGMHYLHRLF